MAVKGEWLRHIREGVRQFNCVCSLWPELQHEMSVRVGGATCLSLRALVSGGEFRAVARPDSDGAINWAVNWGQCSLLDLATAVIEEMGVVGDANHVSTVGSGVVVRDGCGGGLLWWGAKGGRREGGGGTEGRREGGRKGGREGGREEGGEGGRKGGERGATMRYGNI